MDESFSKFIETTLNDFLQWHPDLATSVGGKYHEFDGLMEKGSVREIEENIKFSKETQRKLAAFDPLQLSPSNRLNRELLQYVIDLELFQNEEVRNWEKGTFGPVGIIGRALFMLFIHDFAPIETRVRGMIGRLRQSREFLENSKERWRKPVKLWTEQAIKECQDTPSLFTVIHQAIESHVPEQVAHEFQMAAEEVTKSIQDYQKFLETKVLPKASNNWALGRGAFEKLLRLKKLPYSADEILSMGEKYLDNIKADLNELARDIDPNCPNWEEVREKIKENHPPDFDHVLREARKANEAAKEFILHKKLATIVEGTRLIVMETPEFARLLIPYAFLIPPEALAEEQESHYLVTRGTDKAFLKEFSYPSIYNTSVHEGWPGHHLQISHGNLFAGIIPFIMTWHIGTETVEGWALYCEEMMLKEGFYDDKDFLDIQQVRFNQKFDELWRAVRIILDVKLQTKQISYEDAIDFLISETGTTREIAAGEVTRYTQSPSYPLGYLIGKHLILKLREQLQRELGAKFSLRWFHDVILRAGGIPYYYLQQVFAEKVKELQ